eukprot:Phypoly_transcript_10577.p1 GENE.Phypoly_transcript_10577~~Phypoly_transcript_10577.p1  ORF type:complete len:396 (-),score=64.72 Phypoly_transcript_10577:46-1233(-)
MSTSKSCGSGCCADKSAPTAAPAPASSKCAPDGACCAGENQKASTPKQCTPGDACCAGEKQNTSAPAATSNKNATPAPSSSQCSAGTACCVSDSNKPSEPCCASTCCAGESQKSPAPVTGSTLPCCSTGCCTNESLKEQVRADYAQVATVVAHNADKVATQFGYSLDELSTIPAGANLGVSCGNPLALTNVKVGEVVVDLGSGGGLDCFLASSKVGPSGKVYGIDMTPEMLARAKENAAKRNITNVEFLKGDIEALPLPDAVADLVISNCVINLVPNKQKAFAEIHRILKPGGRLAISDIVIKKDFPPEVKANVGMFSACFTGAMHFADVPKILESAGFQGILVQDAGVDLNAYKELGSGSGCCGSIPSSHPLTKSLVDIDFNIHASSAKIFALK